MQHSLADKGGGTTNRSWHPSYLIVDALLTLSLCKRITAVLRVFRYDGGQLNYWKYHLRSLQWFFFLWYCKGKATLTSYLAQRFSSVTCKNQPGARWETGTKYEELVPSIYRCYKILLTVKPRRIHKNVLRPGGNSHMKRAGMLVGNENDKTP